MNIIRRHIFSMTHVILTASKSNRKLYPELYFYKQYCSSKNSNQFTQGISAITSKYEVFDEQDAPVILDVDEERLKYLTSLQEKKKDDEYCGLNLKRGVYGVYDIEDLVLLLRREKLEDIYVVTLPADLNYVDYIVVATGKSFRHMAAVMQLVRKVYKRKMKLSDLIPRIEGQDSKDWMAIDLGNIALHVFSKSARPIYDLESLWAIGVEYDLACNKPEDPFIALLHKHSVCYGDFRPTVDSVTNS